MGKTLIISTLGGLIDAITEKQRSSSIQGHLVSEISDIKFNFYLHHKTIQSYLPQLLQGMKVRILDMSQSFSPIGSGRESVLALSKMLSEGIIETEEKTTINFTIKTLILQNNKIINYQAVHILNACKYSRVESLDLSNNQIDSSKINTETFKAIKSAFREANLKEIYLDNNNIGDQGIKCIANAIANTRAETLCCKNCQIGDEGAKFIAKFIEKSSYISSLNLQHNKISSKGIEYIAESIPSSVLTNLRLLGNQLDNEDTQKLLDIIPQSTLATIDDFTTLYQTHNGETAYSVHTVTHNLEKGVRSMYNFFLATSGFKNIGNLSPVATIIDNISTYITGEEINDFYRNQKIAHALSISYKINHPKISHEAIVNSPRLGKKKFIDVYNKYMNSFYEKPENNYPDNTYYKENDIYDSSNVIEHPKATVEDIDDFENEAMFNNPNTEAQTTFKTSLDLSSLREQSKDNLEADLPSQRSIDKSPRTEMPASNTDKHTEQSETLSERNYESTWYKEEENANPMHFERDRTPYRYIPNEEETKDQNIESNPMHNIETVTMFDIKAENKQTILEELACTQHDKTTQTELNENVFAVVFKEQGLSTTITDPQKIEDILGQNNNNQIHLTDNTKDDSYSSSSNTNDITMYQTNDNQINFFKGATGGVMMKISNVAHFIKYFGKELGYGMKFMDNFSMVGGLTFLHFTGGLLLTHSLENLSHSQKIIIPAISSTLHAIKETMYILPTVIADMVPKFRNHDKIDSITDFGDKCSVQTIVGAGMTFITALPFDIATGNILGMGIATTQGALSSAGLCYASYSQSFTNSLSDYILPSAVSLGTSFMLHKNNMIPTHGFQDYGLKGFLYNIDKLATSLSTITAAHFMTKIVAKNSELVNDGWNKLSGLFLSHDEVNDSEL